MYDIINGQRNYICALFFFSSYSPKQNTKKKEKETNSLWLIRYSIRKHQLFQISYIKCWIHLIWFHFLRCGSDVLYNFCSWFYSPHSSWKIFIKIRLWSNFTEKNTFFFVSFCSRIKCESYDSCFSCITFCHWLGMPWICHLAVNDEQCTFATSQKK